MRILMNWKEGYGKGCFDGTIIQHGLGGRLSGPAEELQDGLANSQVTSYNQIKERLSSFIKESYRESIRGQILHLYAT
jgi:hypothetical protein